MRGQRSRKPIGFRLWVVHLFNNIKSGEEKRKDKQYDFYDPLYFDYFRICTFFDENNVAEGFEIRYAPEYIDRVKRLEALCENMTTEVLETSIYILKERVSVCQRREKQKSYT